MTGAARVRRQLCAVMIDAAHARAVPCCTVHMLSQLTAD